MLFNYTALFSWWRHQMETLSALLTLCGGNPPVTGGFPSQRPVTQKLFWGMRLNKRLMKQSRGRWFESPPSSFWRHCNVVLPIWCKCDDNDFAWTYWNISLNLYWLFLGMSVISFWCSVFRNMTQDINPALSQKWTQKRNSVFFLHDNYYYHWDVYVHGNFFWNTDLGCLKLGISGSAIYHPPAHAPGPLRILNWTCYHRILLCQIRILNYDILWGSRRFWNWLSLECLVP